VSSLQYASRIGRERGCGLGLQGGGGGEIEEMGARTEDATSCGSDERYHSTPDMAAVATTAPPIASAWRRTKSIVFES